MLKPLLEKDIVLRHLLEEVILTKAQIDTLLCEFEGSVKFEKLMERVNKRDRKNLTVGSYLRTKKQAYKRVKKMLKTILLLMYLGIITQDTLNALYKAASLLHQIKNKELTNAEKQNLIELLEETVRRLIVISQ